MLGPETWLIHFQTTTTLGGIFEATKMDVTDSSRKNPWKSFFGRTVMNNNSMFFMIQEWIQDWNLEYEL